MARIIYGGLVTEIKGSMGGTTFQSNRYGFTVKNKANVSKSGTQDQALQKVRLQGLSRQWASLTDAERASWNSYATTYPTRSAKNPTAYLSGYNLFLRYNQNFMMTEPANILAEPVNIPAPLGQASLYIIEDGGGLEIFINDVTSPVGWYFLPYLSRPIPDGQSYIKSLTKAMGYDYATTGTTRSIVCTAAYTAAFGSLPGVGARLAVDATIFQEDSGQVIYLPKQQIIVEPS
jgi:hypothetical protein